MTQLTARRNRQKLAARPKDVNSKKTLRFSVVIPCFNYGQYLDRAIQSVWYQLGEDAELLLIDDGSTDSTKEVAQSYGAKLRYIYQDNQGVFAACRRGLSLARGEYLVFFDADDELEPGAMETLRAGLEKHPGAGMVFGRHREVSEQGEQKLSPKAIQLGSNLENFERFLLGNLPICTGAAAMHYSVFDRLWQFERPPTHGMDVVAIAQTLLHYPCVFIDEVILKVHAHPGRLRDNVDSIRENGLELLSVLFDQNLVNEHAAQLYHRFAARFLRERGRAFYKAQDWSGAVEAYLSAIKHDWRSLSDGRNLRRLALAWVRSKGRRNSLSQVSRAYCRKHLAWSDFELPQKLARLSTSDNVNIQLNYKKPVLLLGNIDDIRHVLINKNFKQTGFLVESTGFLDRGLLATSGQQHTLNRRLIMPLMQRSSLLHYLEAARESIQEVVEEWTRKGTIDLVHEIGRHGVIVAARQILGARTQVAERLWGLIQQAHRLAVTLCSDPTRSLLGAYLVRRKRRAFDSVCRELRGEIMHLVEIERRLPSGGKSFLSQLVNLQKEKGSAELSDAFLVDELITFFLAAYDSSSINLTWTLIELTRHPDWICQVREELTRCRSIDTSELVSPHELPKCRAVLKEAMRLYPSPWLLSREASEDDRLPSGCETAAGQTIWINLYDSNHRESYWKEPCEYRPGRFLDLDDSKPAEKVFFPHGSGFKRCIGEVLGEQTSLRQLRAIVGAFELIPQTPNSLPSYGQHNRFTSILEGSYNVRFRNRLG